MAGTPLKIGETNPKSGAGQYLATFVDGLTLIFQSGTSVDKLPVGSIVSIYETSTGYQFVAPGAAATAALDPYVNGNKLQTGFLEAVTQQNGDLSPKPGEFANGDSVAVSSIPGAVYAVPYDTNNKPAAGQTVRASLDGKITSSSSGTVVISAAVSYGTPGVQNSGQLKVGFAFVRPISY